MAPADSVGDARAAFMRRAWAFSARIAAVMLALYLTLPLLVSEAPFGFAAPVLATVAAALVVAVCVVLALLARHNRKLAAEIARLEARAEELADRNWELKDAAERSRNFL